MIEDLWQDMRFGVRMLAKNPAFTAIAVLVLGLISVAACYLPAHRAALVEPTAALRYE